LGAMGVRGASVEEIILEKLKDDKIADQVANLIICAMRGEEEIEAALNPQVPAVPANGAGRLTYLRTISVGGFRGIGPKVRFPLQPGPGLTLVTGRNGSGKSSLAEAAELALTGDNKRWADRATVWKEGWRNLHEREATAIEIDLTEDGQPGLTTITRQWAADADLDEADVSVQANGGPPQDMAAKGWARPLELYRPFLSYSELGALVSGQPSKMHDALQAILGLDLLIDTERCLADSRKSADSVSKRAKQELPALRAKLAEHKDKRARAAEKALSGRVPDLDTLAALASGGGDVTDERTALYQQVLSISLPDRDAVAAAFNRVEEARAALMAVAGTRATDARRLASLLSAALDHRRAHADEPCPVCGGRVLDSKWAAGAEASIEDLNELAAEADEAESEHEEALQVLARLMPPKPSVLSADLGDEVDASEVSVAWDQWEMPALSFGMYEQLVAPVVAMQKRAAAALKRRADAWQPIANDLAAWAALARESEMASVRLADLKKAIDWLRKVGKEVRNARLAPFAETSAEVWDMLRQESCVELGPISLEGAGSQRKVALNVTIDGVEGAALSVMSQGELHALGLALFLPRATATESPFGFLVIDDPVQSMDPSKVDGLARVLSYVAQTRQVVVFTHDDRLASSIRQLQLPATVWAVTRRERSVVALKRTDDPVARYLDDARAMARTRQLPEQVRSVAVAGLCRGALEAACFEVVRCRQLGAGVPHADVERALESAHTLHHVMALALFGDTDHGNEVDTRVRKLGGQQGVNAFRFAKRGVHETRFGELRRLVEDTEKLTKALLL
jgi:energy-coupling factor transporter ATP-binding protein EcfA2